MPLNETRLEICMRFQKRTSCLRPRGALLSPAQCFSFVIYCSVNFSGALRAPKSTSKYPEFSHRFARFETILCFRSFGSQLFSKIYLFFYNKKNIDGFRLRPNTVVEKCHYVVTKKHCSGQVVFTMPSLSPFNRGGSCLHNHIRDEDG